MLIQEYNPDEIGALHPFITHNIEQEYKITPTIALKLDLHVVILDCRVQSQHMHIRPGITRTQVIALNGPIILPPVL